MTRILRGLVWWRLILLAGSLLTSRAIAEVAPVSSYSSNSSSLTSAPTTYDAGPLVEGKDELNNRQLEALKARVLAPNHSFLEVETQNTENKDLPLEVAQKLAEFRLASFRAFSPLCTRLQSKSFVWGLIHTSLNLTAWVFNGAGVDAFVDNYTFTTQNPSVSIEQVQSAQLQSEGRAPTVRAGMAPIPVWGGQRFNVDITEPKVSGGGKPSLKLLKDIRKKFGSSGDNGKAPIILDETFIYHAQPDQGKPNTAASYIFGLDRLKGYLYFSLEETEWNRATPYAETHAKDYGTIRWNKIAKSQNRWFINLRALQSGNMTAEDLHSRLISESFASKKPRYALSQSDPEQRQVLFTNQYVRIINQGTLGSSLAFKLLDKVELIFVAQLAHELGALAYLQSLDF